MNCTLSEHALEIDSCFRKWGTSVSRPAEALWEMTLLSGAALPTRALLTEEWLHMDAGLGSVKGPDDIRSAVERNGLLDGAAKYALMPPGRSVRVRAEIPLDGYTGVAAELGATLAGFERAASLLHGGTDGCAAQPSSCVPPAQQGEAAAPLRDVLADSGWAFSERPGGSCMVDLDTGSDFRQALVEAEPEGGWRASVELVRWDSPVPSSRDALAVLLLTAAGVVRMVRPTLDESGGQTAARFEFWLAPQASPALLGRGLAALSVASRLCGREAAILSNERIAARYLAVRGFSVL